MNAKLPDDTQPYSLCRPRIATDGGRDLTDDEIDQMGKEERLDRALNGEIDTPDVGILHTLSELPDDFAQLSQGSQRGIAGGFSRPDIIRLIRQIIGSQTKTKTDRLAKCELVDVLIILAVEDSQ